MEKIAKTRWEKEYAKKKTLEDKKNFISEFGRNHHIPWTDNHLMNSDMDKIHDNIPEVKKRLKAQNLNSYTYLTNKVMPLGKEKSKIRKRYLKEKLRNKKHYFSDDPEEPNYATPMGIETSLKDPEEYVDIIHGTNKAKAMSFLNGGNGHAKAESAMKLHNGEYTDSGIQVHSRVKERAPHYARTKVNSEGGQEAILKGKIKRKYLYPNPAGSGFGDEYGLPDKYWHKIKDGRVEDLHGNTLFHQSKAGNKLPYGRTKTPGDPINPTKRFTLGPVTKFETPSKPVRQTKALAISQNKGFNMGKVTSFETPKKPLKEPKGLVPTVGSAIKTNGSDMASNIASETKGLNKTKLGLGIGAGLGAAALGYGIYKHHKNHQEKVASAIEYLMEK